MPRVKPSTIVKLQDDPSCVRNICIMAHVDHGKTSLSDSLLASNGIISLKMAGKIRYLDAREDEQIRGITMESSAVSLYFRVLRKQEKSADPLVNEHLINLIDSPGHIDFSSEVSTASRLCDGAVILIDVVEGVCSQTVTVLRQCWTEKLKPILVLNKIDRLIIELRFTPHEAYVHISKLIEQVNSVVGSFFAGERQLDDYSYRERLKENTNAEYVEKDDADIYFDPANNNIIFASAIDGWGFSIGQMARFYEQRLGARKDKLQRVLWGNYYMDPRTKKIITNKGLKGRSLKPLFVSLILDNIWKIYENVIISKDLHVIEKIVKSLDISTLPRDLSSKDDKHLLRKIMGQWLPVSTAVLLNVIEKLPSPLQSQADRLDTIIGPQDQKKIDPYLLNDIKHCDKEGLVSAYVSKMLSIPKDELPITAEETDRGELIRRVKKAREMAMKISKEEELESRVWKSEHNRDETRDKGRALYRRVNDNFTPEIDPSIKKNKSEFDEFLVQELGPGDECDSLQKDGLLFPHSVSEVDPGQPLSSIFEYEENQFDLSEHDAFFDRQEITEDLQNIFDERDEEFIAFARIYSGTLKVGKEIAVLGPKYDALHPDKHIQTAVISSLYLFMGRDLIPLESCPSGNLVGIGGLAGKILKKGTLMEKGIRGISLADINFQTFPIVRVAVEPKNPMDMNRLTRGLKLLERSDPCVNTYLEDSGEQILCTAGELHLERCLKDLRERFSGIEITSSEPVIPYRESFLRNSPKTQSKGCSLNVGVKEFFQGPYKFNLRTLPLSGSVTKFLIDNEYIIQNLHNVQPSDQEPFITRLENILRQDRSLAEVLGDDDLSKIAAFGPKKVGPNMLISKKGLLGSFFGVLAPKFEFADAIINGFQLAVNEGPLAKEPVQGMCISIEDITEVISDDVDSIQNPQYQKDKVNISGRLITVVRDAIHADFLHWSPRIMWAVYSCDVQTSVEVLGKVYSVVQQRHGRIESEELKEGTPFFHVQAILPVVEAFGFNEDIRKKTSGIAQPQLSFSGFECIDVDPFWVPTTEQELEELGDTADKENTARKHMNNIRRRKGLFVDEKVIQNAEKQRTLKKN